MGKPTGFIEFKRIVQENIEPIERIKKFSEFHNSLKEEEQRNQGARCMDCGVPFCQSGVLINGATSGCPLNNLIPEFNDMIYKGNWNLALQRLVKTNPFPEFTGRVCPAPCEAACTVGISTPAVTIKENERYIIDRAFKEGIMVANPPKYRSGKRVAIIGSGPAGLAAANTINKLGHKVCVYEREDRIGGLLIYGIPNMKLDKNVISRRIELLKKEGINFVTNTDPCKNKELMEELLREYDSIVFATGATKPRDINIKGRNLKGIHFAVDFLKENTRSLLNSNLEDEEYISCRDKNVLIIGGGDTGTDCVATAIRHKAKSVIQLEITDKPPTERSGNNPWPQWAKILKIDYGQEEAIEIFGNDPREYCTSVKEFIGDKDGNITSAITIKVKWNKDLSGRIILEEVQGSEEVIKVDIALLAMGFVGTEEYIANSLNLKMDSRGNILGNYGEFKTSKEKVFVAGDARRGQSLVVWAIKEGIEAAYEVDEYLNHLDLK